MPAACVLDASVAFAWLFQDEASPAGDVLLATVLQHGAVVPPLWFLECSNGLLMAERRGRIDNPGVRDAVALLRRLPLSVDEGTAARALDGGLDLARVHRLTAYDACYVELASRLGLPLATNDAAMRGAAVAAEVALVAV